MNGNDNRNSIDHQESGTRVKNHNKPFQDKGMKRYKNRSMPAIDNGDFRNARNYKSKKVYKSYGEKLSLEPEMMNNEHDRLDNRHEQISYKPFNGVNISKRISYLHERNQPHNSTISDYPQNINETKRNNQPKNSTDIISDKDKLNDKASERNNSNITKNTHSCRKDLTNVKLKLNFLQESQLNNDKFEVSSDHSKDTSVVTNNSSIRHKTSNNGLNPAAVAFTPSGSLAPISVDSSKTLQYFTDAIENGFKSLSLVSENGYVNNNDNVSTEYGYMNHPSLAADQSYQGKLGLINVYQCPSNRQIPRVNYQQQMMAPQFQLALYGPNPQIIRYNPTQNIAGNFPGNYIFYNPIMLNGLYNQCTAPVAGANTANMTPMVAANRLVQLGATDIPVGNMSSTHNIAHQFDSNHNIGNYPTYYTDSINNGLSHIR